MKFKVCAEIKKYNTFMGAIAAKVQYFFILYLKATKYRDQVQEIGYRGTLSHYPGNFWLHLRLNV